MGICPLHKKILEYCGLHNIFTLNDDGMTWNEAFETHQEKARYAKGILRRNNSQERRKKNNRISSNNGQTSIHPQCVNNMVEATGNRVTVATTAAVGNSTADSEWLSVSSRVRCKKCHGMENKWVQTDSNLMLSNRNLRFLSTIYGQSIFFPFTKHLEHCRRCEAREANTSL